MHKGSRLVSGMKSNEICEMCMTEWGGDEMLSFLRLYLYCLYYK